MTSAHGPENALRATRQGNNGYRLSLARWQTADGIRWQARESSPAELYATCELSRLGRTGNDIPPWSTQQEQLQALAAAWLAAGGGDENPFISRLDVACDLAWPAADWDGLWEQLRGHYVAGRTLSISEGAVAWLRPSGPRIVIYKRNDHCIRLEVAMNGAKQIRRALPGRPLAGLRLADIEAHGPAICRAVLLATLAKMSFGSPADLRGAVRRALRAAAGNPTQALGALGYHLATIVAGRAVDDHLAARTARRYRKSVRALFGGKAGPAAELERQAIAHARDFINTTSDQVSAALRDSLEELKAALEGRQAHDDDDRAA